MGRQQYLERLALGRSPFQDPAPTSDSPNQDQPGQSTVSASSQHGDEPHEQDFDNKGRPTNKLTEQRNAALRNAQNAVLALVGVVESKDACDAMEEATNRTRRKLWETKLEAEQERGDDLNMTLEYLQRLLTWWPEGFVARVQAGIYSSSPSFGDVLLHEFRRTRGNDTALVLATFLPGVLPHALCTLVDALLCGALVEGIGQLQTYLGKSTKKRRVPQWLRISAMVVSEVLCAAVGVALMPLEFQAESQRLGLAPTWPPLPPWRAFLPTGPLSSHNFLWTSTIGLSRFRLLGSPGLLLILQRSLTRYQDEDTPIAGQFTSWEYPAVNYFMSDVGPEFTKDPFTWIFYQGLGFTKDPFIWILYHGYILRCKAIRWLGWELEQVTMYPEDLYQNNRMARPRNLDVPDDDSTVSSEIGAPRGGRYRSTSLSMQPVKYLAERFDHFFQRLLILPFESLVVRAVTQSFLATSLPKTSLAVAAMHVAYSPFGGGPLGGIVKATSNAAAWNVAGGYLSKLGLSLALCCSTEVVIFFIIYRTYRRQGIQNFDWKTTPQTPPESKAAEESRIVER